MTKSRTETLVDYMAQADPQGLSALLATNGYTQLAGSAQMRLCALDFIARGGAAKVLGIHPDYATIVEHHLEGSPPPVAVAVAPRPFHEGWRLPQLDLEAKDFLTFLMLLVCALLVLKLFKD